MATKNSVTSLSLALKHQELQSNHLPSNPYKNYSSNNHSSAKNLQNDDSHSAYQINQEQFNYDIAQELFSQISQNDQQTREVGLDALEEAILNWASGQTSAKQSRISKKVHLVDNNNTEKDVSEDDTGIQKENKDVISTLMQKALASLARLHVCCPFPDVRNRCEQILTKLEELGVYVPAVSSRVSRFIPQDEIFSVDTDDEQAHFYYRDSFVYNCRLEHMVMVMAMHPQYLNHFLATHSALLQSNGSIPYCSRIYIAIMAVARYRCSYLVRLFEDQFLLQGGDKEWLRGIAHAPAKLQSLSDLNKLLAHRPWLVTTKHIKKLTLLDSGSRWQMPELLQAIVILCHSHSVALFCQAAGINLEIDHQVEDYFNVMPRKQSGNRSASPSAGGAAKDATSGASGTAKNLETLMETMKKITEESLLEVTREEMDRRFEVEKEEASHGFVLPHDIRTSSSEDCSKPYLDDPAFAYQDFAKRDAASDVPTFRAQDFNWTDHGYSIMKTYLSEVAELLDDKFKLAHSLTYMTLGSKENVDTTSLRGAVWKYVHCMYGIMYDDYDYGVINQLLDRALKVFIKTASCYPERLEKPLYDNFWQQFRHSEKIHAIIMLLEARLQVGLLYGIRAFSQRISEC